MLRYAVRRAAQVVFVVWAAFTVSFVVLYLLPSDPVEVMLGSGGEQNVVDPAKAAALRHQLGLDRPLLAQYATKLGRVLRGDLGHSVANGSPVRRLLAQALPKTATLAVVGLGLAVVLGGAVGLAATYPRFRRLRGVLLGLPPLAVSLPGFWVGLMLLQLFSFRWRWFPAIGNQGWKSIVLPAVTLAVPIGATIAQVLARSLRTALAEAYVETARAKGVSDARIHLRHALRNAALPVLTLVGVLTGELLAGSVVTETVFSRAGVGRITQAAVTSQDIPVVQGVVLVAATVFALVNLAVDLLYPLVDPRVAHRAVAR